MGPDEVVTVDRDLASCLVSALCLASTTKVKNAFYFVLEVFFYFSANGANLPMQPICLHSVQHQTYHKRLKCLLFFFQIFQFQNYSFRFQFCVCTLSSIQPYTKVKNAFYFYFQANAISANSPHFKQAIQADISKHKMERNSHQ